MGYIIYIYKRIYIQIIVKHLWPSPRVDKSLIVVGVPAAAARVYLFEVSLTD